MTKHSGTKFSGSEILLDGNEYDGCQFESCVITYSASKPFGFSNNRIASNCRFYFTGAAADTLATMKVIYSMGPWGQNIIASTFKDIAPDLKKLH